MTDHRSVRAAAAGVALTLLLASGCHDEAAPGSANVAPRSKAAPETNAAPASNTAPEMEPYVERIEGTDVRFAMVPIPGGTFTMGSAEGAADARADERPAHAVRIEPFWIGEHEVTWDEYDVWSFGRDPKGNVAVDAVSRPTPPYTDMTFGMGHDGCPAICMTQEAARTYCAWLSARTGRFYRLPTEAEWEYACRAGTTGSWSCGDDAAALDAHAWYAANAGGKYHEVKQKQPNAWGLYDMHGNVAEWCTDQYRADFYAEAPAKGSAWTEPYAVPSKSYPHVVRGGSWQDGPQALRSAARRGSDPSWKQRDPQIPKSKWYHTDAPFVGFRVVRPLRVPAAGEQQAFR